MDTKEDVQFMDKVVDALRNTATELEEFRLQMALGKSEAKDKYEEVKKRFNLFMHDNEIRVKGLKDYIEEANTRYDELRVQFALGAAEAKDEFEKRKKELLDLVHEIEVKIKTNETLNKMYAIALIDIEQFKVQMEILEQRFKNDKTGEEIKAAFQKANEEFNAFVEKFKDKYDKKKQTRMEHFQSEIADAFEHFKNAFNKP